MTWTKLDEDFDHHPKVVAAGLLAELMHIHALIYCNRFLTDGFVSSFIVGRLLDRDQLADLVNDSPEAFAELLAEIGLWDRVPGGYQIHDFLEYQPSRASVLTLRDTKRRAGQAGGLAKAKQTASKPLAEGLAKSYPVSVSVPVSDGVINPPVVPPHGIASRGWRGENESVGQVLGRFGVVSGSSAE